MVGESGWLLDRVEVGGGGRERVVLVTGALSPVHFGHISMVDRAAEVLEGGGFRVVCGFLSPSHDGYVGSKAAAAGEVALGVAERVEFCRYALEGHPWARVGTWESGVCGRWPDYPEVVASLEGALFDRFGADAPGVVYVCGADHYWGSVRYAGLREVVVVSRGGIEVPSDPARGVWTVRVDVSDPFARLSSSGVRAAVRRGDFEALRAAVHPSVGAALLSRRSDFLFSRA